MHKPSHSFLKAVAASALAGCIGSAVVVSLAPSQSYPINDDVDDPAVWGQIFPLQYELYLKTVDMQRTKYGDSKAEPRTPSQADPRSVVTKSKVADDSGLKAMWQGYAFATDFRE